MYVCAVAAWTTGAPEVVNNLGLWVMESSAIIAPSVTTSLENRCILFLSVHFCAAITGNVTSARVNGIVTGFFVRAQASSHLVSSRIEYKEMAPNSDEVAL